mgnify:CR=1 FL=1
MIDFTLILFWIIALAVLYFLGPISIYFIGILALLSCLCCSSLSTVSSSSVKVLNSGELPATDDDGTVKIITYGTNVDTPFPQKLRVNPKMANIKVVRIQPHNSFTQCGGNYGGLDGFDMTADQVYAAFRDHPYNGEDLGYGYYDGYDYVL